MPRVWLVRTREKSPSHGRRWRVDCPGWRRRLRGDAAALYETFFSVILDLLFLSVVRIVKGRGVFIGEVELDMTGKNGNRFFLLK